MAGSRSTDKWVALLRGVNVGGGNKVPMADLRGLAGRLGWRDVRSYIASGNLVFEAEGPAGTLAQNLRQSMAQNMGVDVPCLVLPGATLAEALSSCPYAPKAGNLVHVLFLWSDPVVDPKAFKALKSPDDELEVRGRLAWIHTPGGFSSSRLAEKIDKVVTGTAITARNLNTVRKLALMLDG